MKRLCACLGVLVVLSLFSVQIEAAPHAHWGVGFHRLTFLDPLDNKPMHAYAFYPSAEAGHTSRVEGYQVAATEEAPIAMGRFPMLMLSHGNTGTPLALHDLITSITQKGFVVVAVLHPGDNYLDQSRLGTLSNLYGRPLQISAAITAALSEPMLSPFVNAAEVGVIGYSAGGETALILSGAQPDLSRLKTYCIERPHDMDACRLHGELVADRSDLSAKADPRVHALLLMAPLSLMFGRHALSTVHVPTLIYAGDNDQLVAVDKNAEALARKLPLKARYHALAGAGHFVFMAPCTAEQERELPALCKDADGVDRAGIHRNMIDEAGRFFVQSLARPSRAGWQTADQ
ncbi:dienelactone hydrolase [Pseudomonas sp. RIT-PI-S]|uniref:alpha/beta hydrolase family protein n=1 Tax=Pseudomonas sp. RIT-PI-S TaxID=3035295 RepID=UPI0021D7E012|nr:dienelactone hydrolase [Pseudomonas sp. RIT-PI-S]